jgi:membrane protein DedA with SNARE-associated domain
MLEWLQSLLAHYGYGAVFVVTFLNNMGAPISGTTLLLGAGFLVGRGTLAFWPSVIIAWVGCFLGTTAGYGLGWHYGEPLLRKIHFLRMTHQRLKHMEHFFKRYGAKGVFFARFVAFLHPWIGLLAGIGRTPFRPFLFYNLAGSVCYALLYIWLGDYLGQKMGFHHLWVYHTAIWLVLLAAALIGLSVFWRHKIYTFFGHPIYQKKGKGFWWFIR